jgi:hypothetical protein
MLHVAALTSAVAVMNASPSKNACRVRVKAPSAFYCYRNDPYNCRLFSSPVKAILKSLSCSPVKSPSIAAAAAQVPMENRLLPSADAVTAAPLLVPFAAPMAPSVPIPAPTVVSKPAPATHYAFVKFKRDSTTFIAPFKVSVGDYVVVEGDRGEDIGCVEEITTTRPSYPVPNKILRRASHKEKDVLFGSKKTKEAATTKATQQLADSLGLSIRIVDTEFQFDSNKLTVFFSTKQSHIDFRKLQRGLFREHRCRIWLTNVAELEAQQKLPRIR